MTPAQLATAQHALLGILKENGVELRHLQAPAVNGHGDAGDVALASERVAEAVGRKERAADRIASCLAALQRIEEGRYGTCEVCARPISAGRLKVIPETPVCVDCADRLEREGDDRTYRGPTPYPADLPEAE